MRFSVMILTRDYDSDTIFFSFLPNYPSPFYSPQTIATYPLSLFHLLVP
jgi:hypothetical protein